MPAQPTKLTGATNDLMKDIISSNPLYKFRKAQQPVWSLRTAAIYIGVSPQAVSNWESGALYPEEPNIRAIARVMNTTSEKLDASWSRWWNKTRETVQTS